jgi:formylglycine-generating enzyme required for sulfatase activity
MIAISGGDFMMGSTDEEIKRLTEKYNRTWVKTEAPQHKVTLKAFYIGKYPITQTQYQAVIGENPSHFSNAKNAPMYKEWGNHPVESVTWFKAVEFCKKLSKITGRTYKLPSEAQWEYACRAIPSWEGGNKGGSTKWSFGDDEKQLKEYAWYDDNSNKQTHPVGKKRPNKWGIYDMHGNVWEWCEDHWVDNYKNTPRDGTANILQNLETIAMRALRGGSCHDSGAYCRSAYRYYLNPVNDGFNYGFRVVCV